jgi:hypothetical protein
VHSRPRGEYFPIIHHSFFPSFRPFLVPSIPALPYVALLLAGPLFFLMAEVLPPYDSHLLRVEPTLLSSSLSIGGPFLAPHHSLHFPPH